MYIFASNSVRNISALSNIYRFKHVIFWQCTVTASNHIAVQRRSVDCQSQVQHIHQKYLEE